MNRALLFDRTTSFIASVIRSYGLLTLLVIGALYHWLQFPTLPANDDAIFLSRGVGRFSVIEFSPHFPGYTGLVLFVRSLRGFFLSDYQALHIVVLILTSMIPVVVFLILKTFKVGGFISLLVVAFLYLQPLLISVAISGLSDGPGLLIWLLALVCLLQAKPRLSGFLAGVMLTVRPSYLFLLLPLIGFLIVQHKRRLVLVVSMIALPSLLSLIYMYSKDGLALFEEAFRFIKGHFLIWGNTSLSEVSRDTWWRVLADYMGGDWILLMLSLVLLMSCVVVWVKNKRAQSVVISFLSILVWTLLFQNPDNMRHMLPVVVLGAIIFALMVAVLTALGCRLVLLLAVLLITFATVHKNQWQYSAPAIHQGLIWINNHSIEGRYGGVIITNEGVELAREYQAKRRVADAWYKQQALWLWAGGAWQMSYKPLKGYGEPVAIFPRRLAGEHATYVYRLTTRHGHKP